MFCTFTHSQSNTIDVQSGLCGLHMFLHDGQIQISPFHILTREKDLYCVRCNTFKNTIMSVKCVIDALYLNVVVY